MLTSERREPAFVFTELVHFRQELGEETLTLDKVIACTKKLGLKTKVHNPRTRHGFIKVIASHFGQPTILILSLKLHLLDTKIRTSKDVLTFATSAFRAGDCYIQRISFGSDQFIASENRLCSAWTTVVDRRVLAITL